METQKEYYYTYYSYEEWGNGYFGSRGCKCLPEEDTKYFGSFTDKTFKPTQKIILKSDYATREEAYADEIILQEYYKVVENPHFVNRAYQTSTKFCFSSKEHSAKIGKDNVKLKRGFCGMSKEQKSENSRKIGIKNKENGRGIFGMSAYEKSELGKRNSHNNKKNKKGIFKMSSEDLSKAGSKGGSKTFELKKGAFAISKEERSEIAKKVAQKYSKINGKKCYELGVGIFSISSEERVKISSKAGKIGSKNTNFQRWKCLVTGHISNPGGLTTYQKKRGIDTSQRIRVE
jgi:hypothetical protein